MVTARKNSLYFFMNFHMYCYLVRLLLLDENRHLYLYHKYFLCVWWCWMLMNQFIIHVNRQNISLLCSSNNSPLAKLHFRWYPNLQMCAATFVIKRCVGFDIPCSRSISLRAFIPISNTHSSASLGTSKISR